MRRWLRLGVVGLVWLAGLAGLAGGALARSGSFATESRVLVHPEGQPPLHINIARSGRGRDIMLLHGMGGSVYQWRNVAPELARSYRVTTVDLKGFGKSDKPFDYAYSPHDQAAIVRAYIKQAGLSRITLVGHSYGGLVALILALDKRLGPHRISRLVLMSAPAYPQPFTSSVAFLRQPVLPQIALRVIPPEIPTVLAFMMEKVGFDRLTSGDISTYAHPLLDPGGPHALIETARQIVPPDLGRIIARYPRFRKKTLLLWCRQDQVVPLSTGKRLAKTMPRARLRVLEGCDHVPSEQAPDAVVATLRQFMAR